MRVSRILMAAGLAVFVGVTSIAALSAQAKTDEDFDKIMKGIGAANGAMRGAAKEGNTAGVTAEAAKIAASVGVSPVQMSPADAAVTAPEAVDHVAAFLALPVGSAERAAYFKAHQSAIVRGIF